MYLRIYFEIFNCVEHACLYYCNYFCELLLVASLFEFKMYKHIISSCVKLTFKLNAMCAHFHDGYGIMTVCTFVSMNEYPIHILKGNLNLILKLITKFHVILCSDDGFFKSLKLKRHQQGHSKRWQRINELFNKYSTDLR